MPWSAISNRPCFRSLASVKAPFSWPNSSESRKVALRPAQFTSTNGALAARAQVVDHPRHPALAGAALAGQEHRGPLALRQQRHLVGEAPACPSDVPSESSPWSGALCTSSASLTRRSRALSATRAVAAARCSMSTGLVRKFSAPSCMARTAVATSLSPVEQDDGGVALAQVLQHLQAVHARQPEVEDDHLGPQPVEGGQAGLAAQLPGDLVAQALEVIPDAAQNVDIVVDEQDGSGHGYLKGRGSSSRSRRAPGRMT